MILLMDSDGPDQTAEDMFLQGVVHVIICPIHCIAGHLCYPSKVLITQYCCCECVRDTQV